mmetsp:Transcript_10761/g.25154  ORF Transcript_10761/g.25154 Transcript_10761/m.25154 type:complete len:258 (-) Transcript_10761:225-998(-)
MRRMTAGRSLVEGLGERGGRGIHVAEPHEPRRPPGRPQSSVQANTAQSCCVGRFAGKAAVQVENVHEAARGSFERLLDARHGHPDHHIARPAGRSVGSRYRKGSSLEAHRGAVQRGRIELHESRGRPGPGRAGGSPHRRQGHPGVAQALALAAAQKAHEELVDSVAKGLGTRLGGSGWGLCGSNAMLEEHRDPTHGDVCRMASGGFYCPIGCDHVGGKPHCAANTGDPTDPCRYRNITMALHVRSQIRTFAGGRSHE